MNTAEELLKLIAFEQRKEETLKRELRKCQTVQRVLAKELQLLQQQTTNTHAMPELR